MSIYQQFLELKCLFRYVTVDGEESIPLASDGAVIIRRAAQTVRLLQLRRDTFYERLSRKLSDRR